MRDLAVLFVHLIATVAPISAFLNVTELKTVPGCRYRIRSLNDWSARYGESFWIKSLFGAPEISNGSCCTSGTTTTEIEFMRRWGARRPPAKPLISVAGWSASVSISGSLTAAACISYPSLP